MNALFYAIVVPIAAGILTLLMPKRYRRMPAAFSFVISALVFLFAGSVFLKKPGILNVGGQPLFRVDTFAAWVILFVGFFGMLMTLYSAGFMKDRDGLNRYFAYILWTIGASIGAVAADHLVLLLTFWGFLGLTLYLLISAGNGDAPSAAKKTLIIVGGSDSLMALGVAIIWHLTGTFQMSAVTLTTCGKLPMLAFIFLALGAFAKAGAMPLHTWIPAAADCAPTPAVALVPASLDKLLGIYFLARLSLDMFVVTPGSGVALFLLVVGAATIIAGVMMALIQHDMKKLLSYHAVSQVGYMVLGIGTANPIGIAGGLFHMLNNALYKSCLFLSAGAVESKEGTTDLGSLGGLSRYMPVTFLATLIAALAISGIPPLNGFVSKWMIYQGIIEMSKHGDKLWALWLIAAMFGSALTLASFMKLIHAVFLGQRSADAAKGRVTEVDVTMWLPMAVIAVLCIVFGVFAFRGPLAYFIFPTLRTPVILQGVWGGSLATLLIGVGILVGCAVYLIGRMGRRTTDAFVGGADLSAHTDMRMSGTEFYNTVQEIAPIGAIYKAQKTGLFDVYEVGKKVTFSFTDILRYLHNGILPTYLVWCFLGIIVLFLLLRG